MADRARKATGTGFSGWALRCFASGWAVISLETIITVGRGTAEASVTDIDDRRVGGQVSPGEPLEIGAVVYPEPAAGADEDTEEVEVQLEVKVGEEVKDLSYEATIVERD